MCFAKQIEAATNFWHFIGFDEFTSRIDEDNVQFAYIFGVVALQVHPLTFSTTAGSVYCS
jgi:hypothetical protein